MDLLFVVGAALVMIGMLPFNNGFVDRTLDGDNRPRMVRAALTVMAAGAALMFLSDPGAALGLVVDVLSPE